MLEKDRLNDLLLLQRLARFGKLLPFRLVVVDVEPQHVAVLDGVRDRVLVQALLKQVVSGAVAALVTFSLLVTGVLLENWGSGETEKLSLGEEFLDGFVILAELGTVALVEDYGDPLIS